MFKKTELRRPRFWSITTAYTTCSQPTLIKQAWMGHYSLPLPHSEWLEEHNPQIEFCGQNISFRIWQFRARANLLPCFTSSKWTGIVPWRRLGCSGTSRGGWRISYQSSYHGKEEARGKGFSCCVVEITMEVQITLIKCFPFIRVILLNV